MKSGLEFLKGLPPSELPADPKLDALLAELEVQTVTLPRILTRLWTLDVPPIAWVMLNPITAIGA